MQKTKAQIMALMLCAECLCTELNSLNDGYLCHDFGAFQGRTGGICFPCDVTLTWST